MSREGAVKQEPEIYGLVLAGGKSTRMGIDKATLCYHGRSQAEHCCNLLSRYCLNVFLSCRKEQNFQSAKAGHPRIYDREEYFDIGPLGGLLSAMEENPEVAWLVLACDMPFVRDQTIATLITNRHSNKPVTAYISRSHLFVEPLCAIYEPFSYKAILNFFKKGQYSLNKILSLIGVGLIDSKEGRDLLNVNNLNGYKLAMSAVTSIL